MFVQMHIRYTFFADTVQFLPMVAPFEYADLPTPFCQAKRETFYFLCKTCRGLGSLKRATDSMETPLHHVKRTKEETKQEYKEEDVTPLPQIGTKKSETPVQKESAIFDKQETREPFVLCVLSNLVKMCAGCRNKFDKPLKSPKDLAIRHREVEKFFDKKAGQMRKVFNNKYYHVSANCIQSGIPFFANLPFAFLHISN